MDSTGIKVEGEGEWNASKHGGPKQRVWRKIHLGIDEQTLEIRAVHCPAGMLPGGEITGSHIGDAPVLPDLLRQIPADEKTGSVTADPYEQKPVTDKGTGLFNYRQRLG